MGIFLYCAYHTRTIYLFTAVLAFPAIVIAKRKWEWKSLILCFSFGIGILSIAGTQMYVNYMHLSSLSPLLYSDLMEWQLSVGMTYSQYETYIGAGQYPRPDLKFVNSIGTYIYENEALKIAPNGVLSIPEYIGLFFKYPLQFLSIYATHFINMLNPIWGGAYITDFSRLTIIPSIANYIILFCSSLYLLPNLNKNKEEKIETKAIRRTNISYYVAIALVLLPCLVILPGAVELRFFIPLYILMYGFVAYVMDIKKLFSKIQSHPILIILCFVIIYALLYTVWSNTYSHTQEEFSLMIG